LKKWKHDLEKRLSNFEIYSKGRRNQSQREQHKNLLSTTRKIEDKAISFKTKGHLVMKNMLLQEKLLGNLGRWEEAINNKKVTRLQKTNLVRIFSKNTMKNH
jgi:hypothetical protein